MSMIIVPDGSLSPGLPASMTADGLKVILRVMLSGCVHEVSMKGRL